MSRLAPIVLVFLLWHTNAWAHTPAYFDTTNAYYGADYQRAHFPGGDSLLKVFIRANTNYPADAKNAGVQGRVIVRFLVDEKGNISGANVIRGIGAGCDAQAVCVVEEMPQWIPASYKKKPVRSMQELMVIFRLE